MCLFFASIANFFCMSFLFGDSFYHVAVLIYVVFYVIKNAQDIPAAGLVSVKNFFMRKRNIIRRKINLAAEKNPQ